MEEQAKKRIKDRGPSGPIIDRAALMQQAVTKRFVEFLDEKGPSNVARGIGVSPQKFYNFKSGVNPNMDTILQVAAAFPGEFDVIYVMTGRRLSPTGEVITPVVDTIQPPAEYVEQAVKNIEKEVETKYQALLAEKDKQINEYRKDKDKMWELVDSLKKDEAYSLPQLLSLKMASPGNS